MKLPEFIKLEFEEREEEGGITEKFMDEKEVVDELSQQYPGKKIIVIRNKEGNPVEIICETEQGFAVAVIIKSESHYHRKMIEKYIILENDLTIFINGKAHKIKMGDEFIIKPGEIHYAVGKTGEGTWVKVYADPPWTPEDHILVDKKYR